MNRNRKQQTKKHTYMGSPWAPGFCPNPFMSNPMTSMMTPYMQTAFNNFGDPGPMFNRNFNNRENYGGGGRFQNQRNQNTYYRGSNRRMGAKNAGNRNYNYGRYKRSNDGNDNKNAKKSKTSEPYNPAEPTAEEDDDNMKDSGSDIEQSSKFGANAPSQDWKFSKKNRRSHYCTVCEDDFAGSFLIHRRTKEHRKNRDKKFPRCRLCRKTFQGTQEFEEHGQTEEHKKKCEDFQALKEQQLVHANLSDSEDEVTALQRYISTQEEDNVSEEAAEAVGTFHVIPLKVFFCKLCQKFFSNYTDGRQIHCRTPDHIQKYKVYFDGKEARAAERNRLKKEEQAAKKEQQAAKKEQQKESEKGDEKTEEGQEEENEEYAEDEEREAEYAEEQDNGEGEAQEDEGQEAGQGQEEEGEGQGEGEAEEFYEEGEGEEEWAEEDQPAEGDAAEEENAA